MLWFADKGTVQKLIVLPKDDLQTEELVLEEVEVFKVGLCSSSCHKYYFFCLFVRPFKNPFCLHQGPDSNNDNEDFIQKGKLVPT